MIAALFFLLNLVMLGFLIKISCQQNQIGKLLGTIGDFSAEDKTVLEATDEVAKAKSRLPHSPE